jgi:hypothetical protein
MQAQEKNKVDELKNGIIIVLLSSLLAGAGTWTWTATTMMPRSEIDTFKKEIEIMVAKELEYSKEVLEVKMNTLIQMLDSIDKRLERLENKQ